MEFKAQKENFEKQSYAIQSDAEVKLAEIQAFLEAERDRHRIEVLNLDVLINFALEARAKWMKQKGNIDERKSRVFCLSDKETEVATLLTCKRKENK